MSKDTARISVERIIKDLQAKTRGQGRVEMALPGVGVLNIYDGIAAVAFDEPLIGHANHTSNKNWSTNNRKKHADGYLTNTKMEKFALAEVAILTDIEWV